MVCTDTILLASHIKSIDSESSALRSSYGQLVVILLGR
jgi:hypothetical protein